MIYKNEEDIKKLFKLTEGELEDPITVENLSGSQKDFTDYTDAIDFVNSTDDYDDPRADYERTEMAAIRKNWNNNES